MTGVAVAGSSGASAAPAAGAAPSLAAPMVLAPSAAGAFVSLSPARVLDTRSSLGATGPVAA
ncbi:hypothetical protein, partial [Terrabacter aerolatus]|uniref:hypothetical protein n=1 Tax=Terrabacter aerolatus TaxID=422442 RepID=UPI0031D35281